MCFLWIDEWEWLCDKFRFWWGNVGAIDTTVFFHDTYSFFRAVITAFFMQLLQLFSCSYYSFFHAVITAFFMQLLQLSSYSYYRFFHAVITAFFMQLLQLSSCSYYRFLQAIITAFFMQLLQLFSCSYYSFFHAVHSEIKQRPSPISAHHQAIPKKYNFHFSSLKQKRPRHTKEKSTRFE